MEFNLSLPTNVSDNISYLQGDINNLSDKLETGVFDNILDDSFCDNDELEDIDYNLILNLLNNLSVYNQENYDDINEAYNELEQVDSDKFSQIENISTIDDFNFIRRDTLDNIYTNINEVSFNIGADDYKFENKSEILSNNIEKIELSDKEMELLKKVDDIVSENKVKNSDESSENNKIEKLNPIRRDDLDNIYTNINENSLSIETNDYKFEPNMPSIKELKILNELQSRFENKSEILSNNIGKIELSDKEIEVLKKVDESFENILSTNKKFSQLENSNAMETLNLVKSEDLENIYTNINKSNYNLETNDYKFEQNLLSNEEFVILNELQSKFKNKSEILSNNIGKIELSDKEITVLKKLNDIIHESKIEKTDELFKSNKLNNAKLDVDKNVFKSNLTNNEKFSQLENSNTMDKLNLIRSDNLETLDKDLDTLESIVNNNQLVNRDINSIDSTSTKNITTIRSAYIEEDIVKTVEYLKSSSKETITMKISPKELGDMTIKLINDNDESSVVITISKSDVFDLVNDNKNEIFKHLKDLNIDIKEISIEMKNNTENNFSSNLSQEFTRHNQRSKHGNKKNIKLLDEEIDDVEEFYVEENINILI